MSDTCINVFYQPSLTVE